MEEKVTLLVCTCDAYFDLVPHFFALMKKYWKDCPYKILINSETKVYHDDFFKTETSAPYSAPNEVSYGERMINCLKTVDTDYVLVIFEDYFIRSPVSQEKLDTIVGHMKNNPKIASFNFSVWEDSAPCELEGFNKRKHFANYKLSLLAGMWRTEKFLGYWSKKDNQWNWENFANFRTLATDDEFYCIRSFADSPINYRPDTPFWGVYGGGWVMDDLEPLFKENGIEVDYSLRGVYDCTSGARHPAYNTMKKRLYGFMNSLPFKYKAGYLLNKASHLPAMLLNRPFPWCITYMEHLEKKAAKKAH